MRALPATLRELAKVARREREREYHRQLQIHRGQQARLIRWWLFNVMGDRCAKCGAIWPLQLDHPHGRTWEPRKLNCYARAVAYLKDWAAGNLRILCASCNHIDGARRMHEARIRTQALNSTEEVPF